MQNMIFKRKLPIPKEIKEQYPLTAELAQVKALSLIHISEPTRRS